MSDNNAKPADAENNDLAADEDLEEVKACCLKGLEIREELASESKTPGAYDELALSYYKLGTLGDKKTGNT